MKSHGNIITEVARQHNARMTSRWRQSIRAFPICSLFWQLYLRFGLPSTLIRRENGAFKLEEFENVSFSFSCGQKTFWKRSFSKTVASLQTLFPWPKSKMIGECCVFKFLLVAWTRLVYFVFRNRMSLEWLEVKEHDFLPRVCVTVCRVTNVPYTQQPEPWMLSF